MNDLEFPSYLRFIPRKLVEKLWDDAREVPEIPGFRVSGGLREEFPEIETVEALEFVRDLYVGVREQLGAVLWQREKDRNFMDRETLACVERNRGVEFESMEYETVIGKKDHAGRVVIGPLEKKTELAKVEIPAFLEGDQVTLFGPPDTAKMAINAMNAFNRIDPEEAAEVKELAEASGQVPRWGADNEDSKTPVMRDFLSACRNLVGCYDGTIRFEEENGKVYKLDGSGLSKPIKRIPGLALPDGSHFYEGNPLPLHLFDFATHLWHNRSRPEALVFYVPKLENEEEAAYVKALVTKAESLIRRVDEGYVIGTVKLLIVFENPRAIFRIREIGAVLAPHFLGGSLGWHDFLASAARLFKNDPNYRIPVKADPNIVINHIRESHRILVEALEPAGAIRIGGMYGVLYEEGNPASREVCLVGYVRDVTTQLKRGLNGFWVAHPAFVRTGLAMVEAWRRGPEAVERLVKVLIPNEEENRPLLEFVFSKDADGLDADDPRYARSVLAATVGVSDETANNDPEEVRYNVFQALQYICDWLCGNGCVALPATMKNARGEDVFVRIMDDLATTERSRWELWAEVAHGRVSEELFLRIVDEEMDFIRKGEDLRTKKIQVGWKGEAEGWYPIATEILRELVTSAAPVEFATELMLPFTYGEIREAEDPMGRLAELGGWPGKCVVSEITIRNKFL